MSGTDGSPAARSELISLKTHDVFCCSLPGGDIAARVNPGCGLYASDMRFLSELRLELDGRAPEPLDTEAGAASAEFRSRCASMPVSVTRQRIVIDGLLERLTIRNEGDVALTAEVTIDAAADLADIYEVRGYVDRIARVLRPPERAPDRSITFQHRGTDDVERRTTVSFDPGPDAIDTGPGNAGARWMLALRPGDGRTIDVSVSIQTGDEERPRPDRNRARTFIERSLIEEAGRTATLRTGDPVFDAWIEASLRDVHALVTPVDGRRLITAGIPWYVALFGRDSLITAMQLLAVDPALARDQMLALAAFQATADDPAAGAEPGKILHEVRRGELARSGAIPSPYYGTADATPLFVMLTALYYSRTGDLDTIRNLEPNLRAALAWIERHGDLDGDGFVEYERRSPWGLDNQGWKDSQDSVRHPDGALARGPIALVEVQAYVYAAKVWIADVFEALGDPREAHRLRTESTKLRARFDYAFWMPDEGFYALALDGDKRPVRAVASNPGHALYCGIVPPDRAARVVIRLMAPDMFSGWGIRTLSAGSGHYDPASYHNGSVWPHDNALIAAGLKRCGAPEAAGRVAGGMFDAARHSADLRLPELFCGDDRTKGEPYVPYPVACSPQAWAAGVPFMLLAAGLGPRRSG